MKLITPSLYLIGLTFFVCQGMEKYPLCLRTISTKDTTKIDTSKESGALYYLGWDAEKKSCISSVKLLSGGFDKDVKLITISNQKSCSLPEFKSSIFCLTQNPFDNNSTAFGLSDGSVIIWNKKDQDYTTLLQKKNYSVYAIAWHPYEKNIIACALGTDDDIIKDKGIIELWDIKEKKCLTQLKGHKKRVYELSWNHTDPSLLGSASSDKTAKIWFIDQKDLSQSRVAATISQIKSKVNDFEWHLPS